MAGAATAPSAFWSRPPSDIMGRFPVKASEVVNLGDLVALNSSGQVVVATRSIRALGVAVMDDPNGAITSVTGTTALTVFVSIARRGKLGGFTATTLPGTQTIGNNVYLGAVPSATVSNFSMTATSTDQDIVQCVGVLVSTTGAVNGTAEIEVWVDPTYLKYVATLATSNINFSY